MDIYKDPVTDHGKVSKKGLMTLELDNSGKYVTRTEGTGDPAKVGKQMFEGHKKRICKVGGEGAQLDKKL